MIAAKASPPSAPLVSHTVTRWYYDAIDCNSSASIVHVYFIQHCLAALGPQFQADSMK